MKYAGKAALAISLVACGCGMTQSNQGGEIKPLTIYIDKNKDGCADATARNFVNGPAVALPPYAECITRERASSNNALWATSEEEAEKLKQEYPLRRE